MDILAGIFAYVAGLGAVFAAVAMSFLFFVATPNRAMEPLSQPQSATAMLVRPAAPNKTAPAGPDANALAGNVAGHPGKPVTEQHAVVAPSVSVAPPATAAKLGHHKASASAARLRRLVQEERARRWAYQQDSSFESRFLGYAD